MKFYVPNDRVYLLNDQEIIWLEPVDLQLRFKRLSLVQWSNGYMFEADEYIQTFIKILSGLEIPEITDMEYAQLKMDKVAFISKDRLRKMKACWFAFNSRLDK